MPEPPPKARFTVGEADAAGDEWRFNCGPGSVCLLRSLRPEQVRPHFAAAGFERKGYSNPTLMYSALRSLGVPFRHVIFRPSKIPLFRGLVRVQWGGPWCDDGVPPQAAYRHTHWIASWSDGSRHWIGDVNATCCGGWVDPSEWSEQLVPWLLQSCEPKWDGRWWQTHALEATDG